MSLTRHPSVRYFLLLLSLAAAACARSIKPVPQPVPIPVAVTPRATSSTRPATPASAEADSDAAHSVEEAPPTVLPSIVRRGTGSQSTPQSAPRSAEQSTARRSGSSPRDESDQPVRIALALAQPSVRLSATGDWSLFDRSGEHQVAVAHSGDSYYVDARDGALNLTTPSGDRSSFRGPLVARPTDPNAVLVFNGHHYRGELMVLSAVSGLTVVNRLAVEQYLRGVVPLEIGVDRTPFESAAVQAQAIAARSYAYTRLDGSHPYDMLATVTDQVYGGMDAERPVADDAVEATHNMVLLYGGKVVNAPYHANSGGTTAAASEVWRSGDEPYLVSVSDRIPGTDRFYCQDSPKFSWTRTLDRAALDAVLRKYLPQYGHAPNSGIGAVRNITETGRTASGRVAGLTFTTDRGRFTVRANDIRFVLRTPGGDLLPSTLFSFDAATDDHGHVTRLTIHGTGNGHGVGMDQWGAIARARAGQSYVTILETYYPGTNIGPVI